tara:strand:+ start:740 stop:1066 length:327 start_codon:yes stop_codon:yes gene_type:complete
MSNPLRGELSITLGEQSYNCKLNFDSLVRIETALGTPILKLANKIAEADLKITEMSYILYTSIKGGGKEITEKQVSDIIFEVGFVDAIKACGEILAHSLTSGEQVKKL